MVALIALLEDEKHEQRIKTCLLSAGHQVIVAHGLVKAKALVLDHACDLILSNVVLENGGSVFDFLRWLKSDPVLRATPFVLLNIQPIDPAKFHTDGLRVTSRHLGAAKYISMEKLDPVRLNAELSKFLN
ncbi:hypothetical protein BH10CYA1_BH10CYA1_23960 [soil metagenome]